MVEAGGIAAHPLGEKPLRIAPLGMFTSGCALCINFMPCASSHVTLVGTALGPTLTMGMMGHDPGVSQMLFSPGHQHRSSYPLVYEPTKFTVAKATPAVTGGALLILQMLCRG